MLSKVKADMLAMNGLTWQNNLMREPSRGHLGATKLSDKARALHQGHHRDLRWIHLTRKYRPSDLCTVTYPLPGQPVWDPPW